MFEKKNDFLKVMYYSKEWKRHVESTFIWMFFLLDDLEV